jgi:hypothetical protein
MCHHARCGLKKQKYGSGWVIYRKLIDPSYKTPEVWAAASNSENLAEVLSAAPFPPDAFPPTTRLFVCETAASMSCPVDFVGSAVLAALSMTIRDTRVIKVKRDWSEGALLYTMVVAGIGTKKTPGWLC